MVVEAAEQLLDQELRVLDHGFVRLVDYLGGDARIVQSARVSYGAGTKTKRQDRGLIHYLLRNEHTSPFEQVVLTFHLKMPIFVARQWVRHRTARMNEISGRYSIMRDEFYLPEEDQMRVQSTDNKQGRGGDLVPEAARLRAEMEADQRQIYAHYEGMLESGLAREIARTNLPLSLYTEFYWQIDLHNLFHFMRLRLDAHAQYEIRVFAERLAECAKAVAPLAYEAFEKYIWGSVRLSSGECAAVAAMLAGKPSPLEGREQELFEQKLALIQQAQATPIDAEPEPQPS